jgi:hypothetical protein
MISFLNRWKVRIAQSRFANRHAELDEFADLVGRTVKSIIGGRVAGYTEFQEVHDTRKVYYARFSKIAEAECDKAKWHICWNNFDIWSGRVC